MKRTRTLNIEMLSGDGKLDELKDYLGNNFTQNEIDIALSNALAYSEIKTADFLISIGADISYENYSGVYYSVHNDELEGLKYSISKGVDINENKGIILNTGIITAINTKSLDMVKWILDNGANIDLLSRNSKDSIKTYGSEELKALFNE